MSGDSLYAFRSRLLKIVIRRSLRSLAVLLFTCSFLFGAAIAQAATEDLDQVLRAWVAQNIYFENDRLLLIRKRPVRAYIKADEPEVAAEARKAITNFADAFGLEAEFMTTDANLVVITANEIADGAGKPNAAVLGSVGLTEDDTNLIVKTARWAQGCGVYSTRDSQCHVSTSVIAGDKSLSAKELRSCVATGIIFSFGLRIRGQVILDYSNDYIKFLLLGRSLAGCERKISTQKSVQNMPVRDVYVECILNGLKAKLSE